MRRALPVLAALLLTASSAMAQVSAVDNLFTESSHDFGTVARGTKLRYTFWLVNTSNADIQVLGYQPKCGCTEVKLGAQLVPPGTRTPIEATLDTTRFQGQKNSGLTLKLNAPYYVEKDLALSCFIRGDVRLDPGVVDFGQVARGTTPSVVLNLNVAGRPSWRITGAQTLASHVRAKIDGPFQAADGGLQYQITATLNAAAPVGYLKDEITLSTNDSSAPTIPISVAGNIQAAVAVTPGNLVFGRVKAGQEIRKDVLVRSSQNQKFKITGATSPKGDLSTSKAPEAEAPLHRLTIILKAPMQTGPYNAEMQIATNLKDEPPARFTAYATVIP